MPGDKQFPRTTGFVAVVAHLLVILGVTFAKEDRDQSKMTTLDVVLVQSASENPPEDAKLLAHDAWLNAIADADVLCIYVACVRIAFIRRHCQC